MMLIKADNTLRWVDKKTFVVLTNNARHIQLDELCIWRMLFSTLSATSFMHAKLGLHKKLLCFYLERINLKILNIWKNCSSTSQSNHKNIIPVHQFIVLWGNKSDSKVLCHVHQSVVCIHLISKIFNRILRALCLPL